MRESSFVVMAVEVSSVAADGVSMVSAFYVKVG